MENEQVVEIAGIHSRQIVEDVRAMEIGGQTFYEFSYGASRTLFEADALEQALKEARRLAGLNPS
jgi:hypothetical protein